MCHEALHKHMRDSHTKTGSGVTLSSKRWLFGGMLARAASHLGNRLWTLHFSVGDPSILQHRSHFVGTD
jgi:hypothetical protein